MRLRAYAGLAHFRSLRPCSVKRATGTFYDPRNAGGVRFCLDARYKKAGHF